MEADYCDVCDYYSSNLIYVYDVVYNEWVWVCRACYELGEFR